MRLEQPDVVVVGSGISGLITALLLSRGSEVAVLTKSLESGNSYRAQGGIAAAVGKSDHPKQHGEDTLRAGGGLCDPDAVETLVTNGPAAIELLHQWGTHFDRDGSNWSLCREGAHRLPRVLHAGDATGAAIMSALLKRAGEHPRIRIYSGVTVTDLAMTGGECTGVWAVDETGPVLFRAAAVVLATGGCGQVYRYTTNDPAVTGDGLAMAYRAGAVLTDMEFVQFHPTALKGDQLPLFLISEAVRGEGAVLVNEQGHAFMKQVHPWGDLAPRDVVAQAIFRQMEAGRNVFLDARKIGTSFEKRFPTIWGRCRENGLNPTTDLLPVTPAAHFVMGGIRTDSWGQTTIPRLFAVGEAACTGVHGANRLASNSLLEGVVYGRRVSEKALSLLSAPLGTEMPDTPPPCICRTRPTSSRWKTEIQRIMWETGGIIRSERGLTSGLHQLAQLEKKVPAEEVECRNMITVAQLILRAAKWRQESRGGHYREDYPNTERVWAKKHSRQQRGTMGEPDALATVCS
ncbi:L-aspartate oxidase [Marinithermofilum abyssi]|uniref:L-aspartate oxidase n=1 Tax=Marinithermofilum abyssi TaxID=1571185 RepID=UPI001E48903D|nr:L-aspartate oxidase [Marinithermofilum abyssi]